MSIEVDADATSSGVTPNLSLVILDLPYEITLEEYIEYSVLELKNMLGEDLEISQELIEFGGMPAGKLAYELQFTDLSGQPQVLAYEQILMLKGTTQYVLTFTSSKQSIANLTDTYNLISNSFELVNVRTYCVVPFNIRICSYANTCG